MKKKRVLSGIAPSGKGLHVGNYFGAVKPQIELQDSADYEVYYFVADLHGLTTVQNRSELEENVLSVILDYLALGLDPKKCVFFKQSDVAAHCQLSVVFSNYTPYGQMKRMHAFKDKLQEGVRVDSINMGLFNYPILMAADILAYKPDVVPVGEDQKQHVELARDVAGRFNRVYNKEIFPLPAPLISRSTGRIVGTDGKRKMSKSLGNVIGIFEDEEEIKRQIMSSYTDPKRKRVSDPGRVEGNPIFLYHDLINDDKREVEDLKRRYKKGKVGDVEVKERLFEAHMRFFRQARKKRLALENDLGKVKAILREGARRASRVANETLSEVYEIIGIKGSL